MVYYVIRLKLSCFVVYSVVNVDKVRANSKEGWESFAIQKCSTERRKSIPALKNNMSCTILVNTARFLKWDVCITV